MKKKIAAIALALTLATVGMASARGGMGGGNGAGYHHPQMQAQMYQQADKATRDKLDAFFRDTQGVRKQIIMKQAERQALLQSTNPDPAAAAKISGELFDLQATMQDKARAAGIDTFPGGPGRGGMMGGRGMGLACRM